jgi:RHH-type rel operon transcriptional repressor/antitoxin RelB
MLTIRLDADTEKRLANLARKTGRTKTFYAREAILEYLDDIEDILLATQRLQTAAKSYSARAVKRKLHLQAQAARPTTPVTARTARDYPLPSGGRGCNAGSAVRA